MSDVGPLEIMSIGGWLKKLIDSQAAPPEGDWEATQAKIEQLCKGISTRELPGPIKSKLTLPFGKPAHIRIAQDPLEFEELLAPERDACCPVCGTTTEGGMRVPASLEIKLVEGNSYLQSIWVHEACLKGCTETNEQRAVPS